MKLSRIIITTCTGIALCVGAAGAQQFPERPVLEAAQKATPTQRVRAFQHVQKAYPGVAKQMHSQLKAEYPQLEHKLVDSALAAWEQNPGHVLSLMEEIEQKHGQELKLLRQEIRAELETSYPNFRARLKAILDEKGLQPRWLAFLTEYDPGLVPEVKSSLEGEYPVLARWEPGKFRQLWWDREPGTHPLLDKLRSVLGEDPSRGPKLAKKVLAIVRQRTPGLAEDYAVHWFDQRRELIEALQHEFPGAAMKIAQLVEDKHPELRHEIRQIVESKGQPMRAAMRREVEARLPGFEDKALALLDGNYPNLRSDLLKILADN